MSDEKKQVDFAAALAQLKASYLSRLPEEFTQIEKLMCQLHSGQECHAQIEDLRQRFHKLAGSSGTFGLSELGAKAKEIEQVLKDKNKNQNHIFSKTELDWLQSAFIEVIAASKVTNQQTEVAIERSTQELTAQEGNCLWLIEDDDLLAKELKRQFETFGFNTEVFNDLETAEARAKDQRPNAILLDVMFDDEKANATEQFAGCKQLQKLKCPVIFMSAYDDFDSRIRAVQLKAKGYFLKPISVPSIVNHLRRVFETVNIPDSRILIVEDDVELAKHFELVLNGAGFEAKHLEFAKDIIEVLNQFNPEVVLMDLHMPQYNGMELAGVIRQHEKWLSLPILYLSAETDIEMQSDALEKGAEDFLTKPINDVQLVATVRARVIRSRQLDEKISRDSLTGLLKHAVIKESVNHEVGRSRRNDKACSVVMLDIDHFKSVNDTYGHAVGDVVITALATVLQQRLRHSDIIGRYGGEEFVAVLPECDSEQAFTIFEDIRKAFNNVDFTHNDEKFSCSFSAGLICTQDFPDLNGEQLLVSADTSLYHSKENGRNKITRAEIILSQRAAT